MAIAGDPLDAFMGGFGGSLGKGLTAPLTDSTPNQSAASAATYGTTMDGSNWSLNFGSGQSVTPTSSVSAVYPTAQTNQLGTYSRQPTLGNAAATPIASASGSTLLLFGIGAFVLLHLVNR